MDLRYVKTFENFNKEESKTYSIYFVAWFTGTSLCSVKHPEFGKHQLTPEQVKLSSGEYKNKIYKNIEKAIKNGDITESDIEKHSKRIIKESKDADLSEYTNVTDTKSALLKKSSINDLLEMDEVSFISKPETKIFKKNTTLYITDGKREIIINALNPESKLKKLGKAGSTIINVYEDNSTDDITDYYVKNSSWFDTHKYDVELIKNAVKKGGGIIIKTSRQFGRKTEVVTFCANKETKEKIQKEIQSALGTEHIIISKKDW